LTKLLIRLFIKNSNDVKEADVRERYGVLSGFVGIVSNFILFIVKLIIGMIIGSVAITADSFHNLADSSSALITVISFHMGIKPADKEHPFGHGRIEYISALVISFLILLFGWEFLKESITKILHPDEINFQLASVFILVVALLIQIWMSFFYRKIGKSIDSITIIAMSREVTGDVLVTGVTALAVVFTHITGIKIDGFAGLFVSVVLFKNGYDIAKDTLSSLLGKPADPELARKIKKMVESYDGIIGSHDLIIHNYGPNHYIVSIHAEVPVKADILTSHEAVDLAEREVAKALGIVIVIHMDPVDTEDENIKDLIKVVNGVIAQDEGQCSAHDFRLVNGKHHRNFIFDLIIPYEYTKSKKDKLLMDIQNAVNETGPVYHCIVNMEYGYTSIEDYDR